MKTLAVLTTACLIIRLTAIGMGYPQDMFAEHVTVKAAAGKKPTQGVKSTERSQHPAKATGQESATHPSARVTSCPQSVRWPSTTTQADKASPLAIRTFDLDTGTVEERMHFLGVGSALAPVIHFYAQLRKRN